jgi:hypothetical protein
MTIEVENLSSKTPGLTHAEATKNIYPVDSKRIISENNFDSQSLQRYTEKQNVENEGRRDSGDTRRLEKG